MEIKPYEEKYFEQLCDVMDAGRMQELQSENLEGTFIPLKSAPYLDYLLNCKIYLALDNEEMLGFIGFRPHSLEFVYVRPDMQGQGIASQLIERALSEMSRPVKLDYSQIIFVLRNCMKSLVLRLLIQ
ncbi:GNAT family N-acetyltransferase [uncultured Lactobacillus sp.]|uniref:GNAT family N-acetyltransferase n=1 Tax=uncultured Lactobacillus sp. TaxID=153152 RepID=UPI0028059105|nr:GNAT family N-acetyltransferase [uncultured Lactobacillus sp.]